MSFQRIAGICLGIVITAAIADGQWQSDTAGNVSPQLRVHTHTESGGRTVVVETLEGVDIDGKLAPLEEVVTETIPETPPARDTTHTRQDVFRVWDGRRRLAETTVSRKDTQSDGSTSAIHNTWVPDLNGRLRLTSQLLEESRALTPDVRRTDTTLLVADINGTLREIHRSDYTAHQVSPEVVRHEGTELARDLNGGWRPIEIRRGEVRKSGTSERVEEETIQRPDLSGNLAVKEVNLTRLVKVKS